MNVQAFWDKLPQVIKVLCYVAVSAAVAELVKILSGLKIDSIWVAGAVNVILVVLRESQKRTIDK
jgi:hypothetical protein